MSTIEHFTNLIQFRQAAYGMMGNAQDALFELTDAVIQSRQIQSFAELSCAPVFRRKWPSVYEALQDGRPNRVGLMQLYLKQLTQQQGRLMLAGDHTAWPRLSAPTLEGRSYQHHPDPIPGRRPITIGYGYSTLAVVPETHGSWALPLLHERIEDQKPVAKAGQQLRAVCQALDRRPITLWDSEYGCARFLQDTADVPADKLIRLRTNLCLEGPTKPYKGRGQYPKHGEKFKFLDPSTWWAADQVVETDDPDFGPLTVRIWSHLRFQQALDIHLWVAQVERTQAPGTRRKPKLIWLAWVGEAPPEHWWSLYARRYPIDHWYRFCKGRLHWTTPHFATPQQADRWSDLMPLITWELWLARPGVSDHPLPWQKPKTQLPPGRTCQGMEAILAVIGTPALPSKPRGYSPGWPVGTPRNPRPRFDLIRSEQWKTIKERKKASQTAHKSKRGRPKTPAIPLAA
jgi:hypothetical protein